MAKPDDDSFYFVIKDDPGASQVTKNSKINGGMDDLGRKAITTAAPEPGGGSPLTTHQQQI